MSSQPEWFIPDYPPLKSNDLVGRAAVEGQIVTYPKIVRTMTDTPINNQTIGNVSFMLFSEPKKTKNGHPIYGFLKLRGNWNSEPQATFEASKIIREVDSKYPVKLAPVGYWVPITEDEESAKTKTDVRMKEEELQLRDEAVKEKEAESRRVQRELHEKSEELKHGGDIYDDPTSLKYYSMRMVTSLRLKEEYDRLEKQLSGMKVTMNKVHKELSDIESKYNSYKDDWVECYNIERQKSGIPDFCPSLEFLEYHQEEMNRFQNQEGEREM